MDPVEPVATPSVDPTPVEPTPSVTPPVEVTPPAGTPTPDPVEPTPTPAEPQLFDLPDGRKVDAETLAKEFKENFLPEFTRKSQELAEIKKTPTDINKPTPDDPFTDPNYTPENWGVVLAEAERRALAKIDARQQESLQKQQAIETKIAAELAEVKKLDPSVSTDLVFNHAMKYGFTDLRAAHKNLRDMQTIVKTTQTQTVANVAKRNDPIATNPGATGASLNPRSFSSAVDYLRARTGQQ